MADKDSASSSKTAAVVDGGPFKCAAGHKTEFVTIDPNQWLAHLQNVHTTASGEGRCPLCGNVHQFDNERGHNYTPVFHCKKCKRAMAQQFAKEEGLIK